MRCVMSFLQDISRANADYFQIFSENNSAVFLRSIVRGPERFELLAKIFTACNVKGNKRLIGWAGVERRKNSTTSEGGKG